jgi:hypothetical protein
MNKILNKRNLKLNEVFSEVYRALVHGCYDLDQHTNIINFSSGKNPVKKIFIHKK